MMRFSGQIYKDGQFWLAEIPILDAMTQGHTRNVVNQNLQTSEVFRESKFANL
jgi:predicted RNase H-like HicB family nuclease